MQRSKHGIVSRAIIVALASACPMAMAADAPQPKEIQALIDFQCLAPKTLTQLEQNRANMARGYTDRHPVMECLNKKIEELRTAGK